MIKSNIISERQKMMLNFKPNPECCLKGVWLNNIRDLSDTIVYIWFTNKKGSWVYIKSFREGKVDGYVLNGNHWMHQQIDLKRVYAYY